MPVSAAGWIEQLKRNQITTFQSSVGVIFWCLTRSQESVLFSAINRVLYQRWVFRRRSFCTVYKSNTKKISPIRCQQTFCCSTQFSIPENTRAARKTAKRVMLSNDLDKAINPPFHTTFIPPSSTHYKSIGTAPDFVDPAPSPNPNPGFRRINANNHEMAKNLVRWD